MFLYVSTWQAIEGQGILFIESLNLFAEIIEDIEILKNCFSIIVTKFPSDEEMEDLVEKLEKVLESPMIKPKAKILLEIGIKKIFIFNKPARNTVVELPTLLDEIVSGM